MNLTLTIPTFLKPALENDIKFSIIPAGRRTGKTYNVVQWQSLKMLEKPNRTGLWVDTTNPISMLMWRGILSKYSNLSGIFVITARRKRC